MPDPLAEIFRREAGRCTATLIRVLGDIDLAEDSVAEAFAVAAEQWPIRGVPPNPGGWITTTARNRAIDRLRRESTRTDRHLAAHRLNVDDMEPDQNPELDNLDGFVDVVPDDQLRLMFLCCHPALAADAQVGLTLRLLGGLDTPEIARAFLVPEATLAQRIVRAKRKLRDNHAPYRVPRAADNRTQERGRDPGGCEAPRDGGPPCPYTLLVRDVDALAADLHARGLRVTPQRQLIYSLLAEEPSHPTVEDVHDAVREVAPTVSLRTVYQALHDLEEMGEIRLVQVANGPLRVDTRPERHAHLHCDTCGRLHDVDVDLKELVLPAGQRRGFAVEGAEVIFSGRCPMCAGAPQGDPESDPQGE